MIHKKHAKKIIYFPFVPISPIVEGADGGDGCCFVSVGFDPDAAVVTHGEEVVNDFEALVFGGEVDCCYVGDLGVFCCGVVF